MLEWTRLCRLGERERTMTLFGFALNLRDCKQEAQRPSDGGFWFREEDGSEGEAKWCSIAAQGACVCLGREMEPGRELTIHGGEVEIHGRIVWCRPMADRQNFVAGVRILATGKTAGAVRASLQTA